MKNSINNYRRRRIFAGSIVAMFAVIVAFLAVFVTTKATPVIPTGVNLDPTNDVPIKNLKFETTLYAEPKDGYVGEKTFIGIQGITQPDTLSGKTLHIPSEVIDGTDKYKVVKIDTARDMDFNTPTNVNVNDRDYYATSIYHWGSYITGLIIDNGITSMNPGAFYGMASLKYYKAPFVGLNTSDNVNPVHMAFSRGYANVNNTYKSVPKPPVTEGDKDIVRYGTSDESIIGFNTFQPSYSLYGGSTKTAVNVQWYQGLVDNNPLYFWLPCELEMIEITGGINYGDRTFFHIESLKTAILPDSLLTVGIFSFAACKELTYVEISPSMSSLGVGMFSECKKLPSATIPAGTIDIPEAMFFDCEELTQVKIPQSVLSIGKEAFMGCKKLTTALYNSDPDACETSDTEKVLLPSGLETIGYQAFSGVETIGKITIKNSATKIEYGAFMNCYNMYDITLPFVGIARGTQVDGASEAEKGVNNFGFIFGNGEESNQYIATQNGKSFTIPQKLKIITITDETAIEKGVLSNLFDKVNTYIDYDDNNKVKHYGVTSISINGGDNASSENSLTKMEAEAFAGTNELASIVVPFLPENESTNKYRDALGRLFFKKGSANEANYSSLSTYEAPGNGGTYVIPNSLANVTIKQQATIYSGSFHCLTSLKSVEIGDYTTVLQDNIFRGTTSLETLVLPFVGYQRGEFYIWHWWWYDWQSRNLASWVFSYSWYDTALEYEDRSIAYYDSYVRKIPKSLKNLVITDEKTIDTYAFRNLSSLESLTIKNGGQLSSIAQYCATGCYGLKTVSVPWIGSTQNPQGYDGQSHTFGWIFGPSSYSNAYTANQGYKNAVIPKSLESIKVDYVTRIPAYAFANMPSLKAVEFKTNVSGVGTAAFLNDSGLTSITYTANTSFNEVENSAFYGCVGMTTIQDMIPLYDPAKTAAKPGNIKLGANALAYTSISDINFYNFSVVGNYAFQGNLNLISVAVTSNISSFGEGVFANCTYLTSATLSQGQATKYLFKNCVNLPGIDLIGVIEKDENNHYVLPEGMFYNCSSLTYGNLTLSDSITHIGQLAFYGCDSITDFVVPASVISIGKAAFLGCDNLTSITIPKATTTVGQQLFTENIGHGFVIYVYYQENEKPRSTWPEGWNCNNPVKVYPGTDDDSIYQFSEVNTALGGYEIIGFKEDFDDDDTKDFDQTTLAGKTIILPRSHNGVPVVGIRSGVFTQAYNSTTSVAKIIIPSTYKVVGTGCETSLGHVEGAFCNNAHRIDLYFESNNVCSYDTSTGVENGSSGVNIFQLDSYGECEAQSLISSGLIFKANQWTYGTDKESNIPFVLISSLDFIFEVQEYYFTGEAQNKKVDSVLFNAIRVDSTDSPINDALSKSMFNYVYSDNVAAGTAQVAISLNSAIYSEYLSLNASDVHLPLLTGKASKTYTINKQVIDIYWNNNSTSGDTTFGYGDDKIYYTDNKTRWYNDTWNEYVEIASAPLPDAYTFEGKITTTAPDAGEYIISGQEYNNSFYWQKQWKIWYKGKNVSANYEVKVWLKVKVSPMPVTLEFTGGKVNGDYYEIEYTGEDITPTAQARDKDGNVVKACVVEVSRQNPLITTIYPAYNNGIDHDADENVAVAYVSSSTPNYTATNNNLTMPYRIVKAKVKITWIKDESDPWVIPVDAVRFEHSNWTQSDIKITGLGENSHILGRTINTAIGTAELNAKGRYQSSLGNIVWESQNFNLSSSAGGLNSMQAYRVYEDGVQKDYWNPALPYLIYREEMYAANPEDPEVLTVTRVENFYYDVELDMDIQLAWNKLEYEFYIGTDKLTLSSATGSKDYENIHFINYETQYPFDGYAKKFRIKITNSSITEASCKIVYYYGTETHEYFTDDDLLEITAIGNYSVGIVVSRTNFDTIYESIDIETVKCDIEHLDLNKQYDGIPATLEGFITKKGMVGGEQSVTCQFYSNDETQPIDPPVVPGTYKVKIVAEEHEFFNAFDGFYTFTISKRDLKIYVDNADVEHGIYYFENNKLDPNKVYDGTAKVIVIDTQLIPDNKRLYNLVVGNNGLVGNDHLQGVLRTSSSTPNVYDTLNTATVFDAKNTGDWYWQGGWSVVDVVESKNHSSYYNVIICNSFEIKERLISYAVEDYNYTQASGKAKTVTHTLGTCTSYSSIGPTDGAVTYDGSYYAINVTVSDPDTNYSVEYYDGVDNPEEVIDEKTGKVIDYKANWKKANFYYASPGVYKVWYKITAENYQTVCEYAWVIIETLYISFDRPKDLTEPVTNELYLNYDGLDHYLELENVEPIGATVKYSLYKLIAGTWTLVQDDMGQNIYLSTDIPVLGEGDISSIMGQYRLAVEVSAIDYPTKTATYDFKYDDSQLIVSSGLITITGDIIQTNGIPYDGYSHHVDVSYDSSIPSEKVDQAKVYYRKNIKEKWSEVQPLYVDATQEDLMVLVWIPGYKAYTETVNVKINKINFTGISFENYDEIYDGKYHSIKINGVLIDDPNFLIAAYPDATVEFATAASLSSLNIWSTTAPTRKDAGTTNVFVKISQANYNDLIQQNLILRVNQNPMDQEGDFNYIKNKKIQYTAKVIEYVDFEIKTIHDGKTTIEYYFGKKVGDNIVKDDSKTVKANPKELGYYYAVITYKGTANCAFHQLEIGFEIVPREVKIKYNNLKYTEPDGDYIDVTASITTEELFNANKNQLFIQEGTVGNYTYKKVTSVDTFDANATYCTQEDMYGLMKVEFNKYQQSPDPYVVTGTTDTLEIQKKRYGSDEDPTDIGVYYYSYYFKYPQTNYVLVEPSSSSVLYSKYGYTYHSDYPFVFEITKIYLDITLPVNEQEHIYSFTDPQPWSKTDGYETCEFHYKLLSNNKFEAHLYTINYSVGEYIYTTEAIPNKIYAEDVHIWEQLFNDDGTPKLDGDGNPTYTEVTDLYYEINFSNLKINIVYPKLELKYDKNTTIEYDGDDHIINVEVDDSIKGLVYFKYTDDNTEPTGSWKNYPPTFKNVGTHTMYFYAQSGFSSDTYGSATLTITKAILDIEVDDLEATYNAGTHNVTYKVYNSYGTWIDNIDTSKADVRYYDITLVTEDELNALYSNFDMNSDTYLKGVAELKDAGEYYAVVYFAEDSNWYEKVSEYKIVKINQKPIDVSLAPGTAIVKDDRPFDNTYEIINIGVKGSIDDTDLCWGHSFKPVNGYLKNAKLRTESVNVLRDDYGNVEYYMGSTGFQFLEGSIKIMEGNVDVTKNYKPVVPDSQLKVKITPIALTVCEITGKTKQYDGKPANPDVNTYHPAYKVSSDGPIQYIYYRLVDGTPEVNPCTAAEASIIGEYLVYAYVQEGTNFKAWEGTVEPVVVEIIPKNVDVVWGDLEVTFNGEEQMATAYFVDVDGDNIYLKVEAYVYGEFRTGVLYANQYVVYASYKDTYGDYENYNLVGFTNSFKINPLTYVFNVTDSTDNDKTAWMIQFNNDNIGSKLSDTIFVLGQKYGDLYFTSLKLTQAEFEQIKANNGTFNKAQLKTSSNLAGVYFLDDHFDYSNIYVYTKDGKNVYNSLNKEIETDPTKIDKSRNNSINFEFNGSVTIESSKIVVEQILTEVEYKESQIYVIIGDVIRVKSPLNVEITWSLSTKADFSVDDTNMVATDAGTYTFYFKASANGYETEDNGGQPITFIINKKESYLNISKSLDKIYDAKAIEADDVRKILYGEYNKSAGATNNSDLVIKFYPFGSDTPLADNNPPIDAGTYTIKVTSLADSGDGIKNYTNLEQNNEFTFTIKPKTVKLEIIEDKEVDATSITTQYIGTVKTVANLSGIDSYNTLTYQFTSLYGINDMDTTGKETQGRGTYTFKGIVSYDKDKNHKEDFEATKSVDNSLWDYTLTWRVYAEKRPIPDGAETYEYDTGKYALDVSYNYAFDLDYTLVIHYKYMEVSISDVHVKYNGEYNHPTGYTITEPASYTTANLKTLYGLKNTGTYPASSFADNQVSRMNPGVTEVAYKFSYPGYEDYLGTYKITVDHDDRIIDNRIDFNKVYDGVSVLSGATTVKLGWLTYSVISPALTETTFYSSTTDIYREVLPADSQIYVKVGYHSGTQYYVNQTGSVYEPVNDVTPANFATYSINSSVYPLYVKYGNNYYKATFDDSAVYYEATSTDSTAHIQISRGTSKQADDTSKVAETRFYNKGNNTPLATVPTEAGTYEYVVVIPETEFYAETTIGKVEFTITRKKIYVDGIYQHGYNGAPAYVNNIQINDTNFTFRFQDGTVLSPAEFVLEGFSLKTTGVTVNNPGEYYNGNANTVREYGTYRRLYQYIGTVKTDVTKNYQIALSSGSDIVEGDLEKHYNTKIQIISGVINVEGTDFVGPFDGLTHNAQYSVKNVSKEDVVVTYSLDGVNFEAKTPENAYKYEYTNVKREGGVVVPYTYYIKVSANNYTPTILELHVTINPAETTITVNTAENSYKADYYYDALVTPYSGEGILIPGNIQLNHTEVTIENFGFQYKEWDGKTYKKETDIISANFDMNKSQLFTKDNLGNYVRVPSTAIFDNTAVYYSRVYEAFTKYERPKDAGWYRVEILVPASETGNYGSANGVFNFRITGKPTVLNWDIKDYVYNGYKQAPTASFDKLSADSGVNFVIIYSYLNTETLATSDPVDAATYTVTAKLTIGGGEEITNYLFEESQKTVAFTINKKPVTIKLKPVSEKYNGSVFEYVQSADNIMDKGEFLAVGLVEPKSGDNSFEHVVSSHLITTNKKVGYYSELTTVDPGDTWGYLWWNNTDRKLVIIDKKDNNKDVTHNYIATYELGVNINYSNLNVTATDYLGDYDGLPHAVTVKVNNSIAPGDPQPVVTYSTTFDGEYSTTPIYRTNAGVTNVYYKVTCVGYTDIVPVDASDCLTITINKLQTGLKIVDESQVLGKVYDGNKVPNPTVSFATENLTQNDVTYTYYLKNEYNVYEPAPSNIAKNAGDYKLVISVGSDLNYEGGELIRYFTIDKRPITVTLADALQGVATKTYDGVRWSADLNNTALIKYNVQNLTDNKNKGLVLGHTFVNSTIQTKLVNAKTYDQVSDFEWQDETFHIYDTGNVDVSENYDLTYSLYVKIAKASFVVNSSDYEGTYDAQQHTINVDVLVPTKKLYKIYYSLTNDDTTYQEELIYKQTVGAYTVYFKVVDLAGNYDTYKWSAQIIINGLESNGDLIYEKSLTYGDSYADPKYIDEGGLERVQDITYYLASDKTTPLLEKPKDRGTYYFELYVHTDGVYEDLTLTNTFTILPKELTVNWGSTLYKDYNGEYQLPAATITNDLLLADFGSKTMNLTIAKSYSKKDVGTYPVKATFPENDAKQNYVLTADEVEFSISKSGIEVPNIDQNLEYIYYFEIQKKDAYGNLLWKDVDETIPDNMAFGDPVVIKDALGNRYVLDVDNMTIIGIKDEYDVITPVELPYHFVLDSNKNADKMVNSKMTTHKLNVVLGNHLKVGYDSTKTYYIYDDSTKTYTVQAIADKSEFDSFTGELYYKYAGSYILANFKLGDTYYVLENGEYQVATDVDADSFKTYAKQLYRYDSGTNYMWKEKKNSDNQVFEYTVKPYALPNAEENTKVNATISAAMYEYQDGEAITPIPTIVFKQGGESMFTMTASIIDGEIVDSEGMYSVSYSNNIKTYEDSGSKSTITIKGVNNFTFTEKLEFTIVEKTPDLFTLKEGVKPVFMNTKIDNGVVFDEDGDFERTIENRDTAYLGHVHQKTTVATMINQFANETSCIQVYTIDGTLVDSTQYEFTYVGTGMVFKLYKNEECKEADLVDTLETIIFGDLNGDGLINAGDTLLYKNINADKMNLDTLKSGDYISNELYTGNNFIKVSCYYATILDRYSGYTKPNAAMALMMKTYNAGTGDDFNAEYEI